MKTLLPKISIAEQEKLSKILLEATSDSIGNIQTDMIGIPKLQSLTIQKTEGVVEIPKTTDPSTTTRKKEIFIYNPLSKKNKPKYEPNIWIKNKISKVKVSLQNPFHFAIPVEAVSLIVEGIDFHPHFSVLDLPPQSTTDVELSGVPLEEGDLVIKG